MVKIGWMVDKGFPRAGMVLSVEAFQKAMPQKGPDYDSVMLYHCDNNTRPPDDLDVFVLHGDQYDRRWIDVMKGKPMLVHRHGGWAGGDPVFRRWILDNASLITFNSPKQRELFRYPINVPVDYIPLPIDVDLFENTVAEKREGTLFASIMVPSKGVQYVLDWALRTGEPVDFYGPAPNGYVLQAIGPPCRYRGSVTYEEMPALYARYAKFVFMPHDPDLYARVAVEAYASGCDLILDGDEKAFWDWLDLDACRQAPLTFWDNVMQVYVEGGNYA